ncbi:MAG: hypothetical protein GTN81_00410 [Proteobacteria bacterium]|nr:hypothetical protein [Pseudomonadota bacterium]
MPEISKSVCDVDQGWVTKDRSGMVVIGLGNDELHASFKMTRECFERFYKDLSEFRERNLKGSATR